jgi:hypothetical protein
VNPCLKFSSGFSYILFRHPLCFNHCSDTEHKANTEPKSGKSTGGEGADVVGFGIDSERHFESPLFRSLCGHDINHSEVLETQANSEINLWGRTAGDGGPRLAGIGI